jgi:hypothetical protein
MGILSISGWRFRPVFVALLLAVGCGAGDLLSDTGPTSVDAGLGGAGTNASGGRAIGTGGRTVSTGGRTIGTGGRTIGTGGTVSTGGRTISTGGRTIGTGGSGATGPVSCTTVASAASCTNATIPEINLGEITATACHDQCETALASAGMTTGCWVLATDLNCYCRGGVLNPGGSRPGGSCASV